MNTLAEMIKPDFQAIWTKEEAEKEMPGFLFKGIGWYLRPEATMVVFPSEIEGDFLFWAFFGRDPRAAFQVFFSLPVLMDPVATAAEAKLQHVDRIIMIGTVVLVMVGAIVGYRWGLLAELPILLVLMIWNVFIRNLLRKS